MPEIRQAKNTQTTRNQLTAPLDYGYATEKIKRLLNTLSCSNMDIDEVLDNMESMGNKKY